MHVKTGIVTSARMQGTVTVTVHRYVMHSKYSKRYRVSKKFLADTNGNTVGVGDEVVITECRPLSKRKHFRVTEVRRKGNVLGEIKEESIEQTIKRDHRDALHKREKTADVSTSSA